MHARPHRPPTGRTRRLRRVLSGVLAAALAGSALLLGAAPATAAGFSVAGAPSIADSAWVGTPLAVSFAGMDISPAVDSYRVSWHWSDGTPRAVLESPDTDYTPTAADLGRSLYADVLLRGANGELYAIGTNLTGAVALRGFDDVPTLAVTGSGVVGEPLTVGGTGDWWPTPQDVEYVWHRYPVDAVVASGTGPAAATYVPTVDDIGSTFYVVATASRPGYADNTQASTASTTVHLGSFAGVERPTVTGTGVVGSPFTATLDVTGTTPAPASVDFQWYRTDGTPVAGATSATFTPGLDLLGEPLYVVATLRAPGHQDFVTLGSDYSATVSPASFEGVGRPVVTGSGVLGTSFTAALDVTGTTPAPASVDFQWYRTDGTPVAGATSATLTPGLDLVGQPLYVVATLRAPGHHDYVTLGSDYTRTVSLASFAPGAAPVLTGHHVLTGTLTATLDTSAWTPRPQSLTYRWFLADGTPVAGETGATLRPTAALVGESVYVEVTAHAEGYQPYVIASAPSGTIAAATAAVSQPVVVTGSTVTVEVWGLLPDTDYALELHSTPVALGTFRSSSQGVLRATVTLPAGTALGAHSVVVLLDGAEVARVGVTVTAPGLPPATPAAPVAAAPAVAAPAAAALATTGAGDASALLAVVALLLVGGAAAVRVAARR
ncbi:MAG: hypothetical protein J7503_13810 [Cellulomonas iranensis]|uniref:hypothetical protein n=1 Tax=Cellulomonas iranensis TaxID=76862 RepID=UPI001B2ECFFC|nr:hypothetical protein [Cellulomonas iranensis]MBO9569882.1 hypothetical protein [Cellulomonas iranensis]